MSVLSVNPQQNGAYKPKRKLVSALRGHKLLKDKRDELMRQFLGAGARKQSAAP